MLGPQVFPEQWTIYVRIFKDKRQVKSVREGRVRTGPLNDGNVRTRLGSPAQRLRLTPENRPHGRGFCAAAGPENSAAFVFSAAG